MGKIFMRGLIAVAPIAITLGVLVWLLKSFETVIGGLVQKLVGPQYYFPGLGIIVALIVIFIAGLFLNNYLVQKFQALTEKCMTKIPLVKTLYSSLVDLMNFFQKSEHSDQGGRVVRVATSSGHLIGIVTRENFEGLPEGVHEEGEVAVFIPMSYQIGGFTIMAPRSSLSPVDMKVEEGMRFVVTAGALKKKEIHSLK